MSRALVTSLALVLVALPSCSLIIDTNPDGVIYSGGTNSHAGANGGGQAGNGGSIVVGAAGHPGGKTNASSAAGATSTVISGAGSPNTAGGSSAGGASGAGSPNVVGGATVGGTSAGGVAILSGGSSSGGKTTTASAGGPTVTGGTQAAGGTTQVGGMAVVAGSPARAGAANFGGAAGTSGVGPCSAGTQQCKENLPQLCSSAGLWQDQTVCSGSTPTCSGGACICTAGTLQCKNDGITPQFCSSTGFWQDRTACGGATPVCNGAGVCGACQATLRKCDNSTPVVCSAAGNWEPQAACSGATPFCAAGACTATCPGNGGPTMKLLPEGYCIDTTEVTREQYQTWLVSNPVASAATQIADCSWNGSYVPASQDASFDWPPTGNYKAPVAWVDWCDAYAFCSAVGKRLCGKIGGGAFLSSDFATPNLSQWINACSSHGANDYTYGDTFVAASCNGPGADDANPGLIFVASLSTCQSPVPAYAGVFDLSGNVEEWEDNCPSGEGMTARCYTRGSWYGLWDTMLMCTSTYITNRNATNSYTGFRCCSP